MSRLHATIPPAEARLLEELRAASLPSLRHRVRALRRAGWTLDAIGGPLGLRRSTIRSWEKSEPATLSDERAALELPLPPPRSVTSEQPSTPRVTPQLTDQDAARLRELSPRARSWRSGTPSGADATSARDEMDRIVAAAYARDVPIAALARAAGVTHRAMTVRVRRAKERFPEQNVELTQAI